MSEVVVKHTCSTIRKEPEMGYGMTGMDLVMDGGNVVKCGDTIVMTEKIFVENKDKSNYEDFDPKLAKEMEKRLAKKFDVIHLHYKSQKNINAVGHTSIFCKRNG